MILKTIQFLLFGVYFLSTSLFASVAQKSCIESITSLALVKPRLKPVLFYHHPCPDGFTCAWVFHSKFKDGIRYLPTKLYAQTPLLEDGTKIYMADVSFPRDVLVKLRKRHSYMRIIEHHDTAEKNFRDFDRVTFDTTKSAGRLTWEHWYVDQAPPKIVLYTEDRDLWKWKLPYSREINAYIETQKMTFTNWYKLAKDLEDPKEFKRIKQIGTHLVKEEERIINELVSLAEIVEFEDHIVPITNASVLRSEVGHRLLAQYPNAKFSMTYSVDRNGHVNISLRSENQIHVGNIASLYGGGGHKNAASYKMSLEDFTELMLTGKFVKR